MTDVQVDVLKDALRQSNSITEACVLLSKKGINVDRHGIRRALTREGLSNPSAYLRTGVEASRKGDHPNHKLVTGGTTAPGYVLSGVSTLVDKDGVAVMQWVKTKASEEAAIEALRQAVELVAEPLTSACPPIAAPKSALSKDLICVYPMGDPHLGMYAWDQETGQNHNLQMGTEDLLNAVDYLVSQAPASERAIVANLGDFFHSDNQNNMTARSGNHLDVDGRFGKVFSVGLQCIVRCINRALEKHKVVEVINVIGNHDDHLSVVLSSCLKLYYQDNKRVVVHNTPTAHHYVRFGSALLGFTHGHHGKLEKLQGVMSCDRSKDWGETSHRYWLTGHIHHDSKKELAGCTVESFRTLAPKDAWATFEGYRSGQDMKCIVYHKDHGELQRYTSNIQLVRSLYSTTTTPKRAKR